MDSRTLTGRYTLRSRSRHLGNKSRNNGRIQAVKTTEYVNVPVTRLEKERIRDLAHNARLSNGRYLKACLEGTKSIPELEGEIKRLNG